MGPKYTPTESEFGYIKSIDMAPSAFIDRFRNCQSKKDIWLLGGAQLAHSFANAGLIDEIILTTSLRIG